MSATKVTLRKRELPSGKITLYLDFYPPVRNPRTMELSRREYLGIYLVKNPRTAVERRLNNEKYKQAEAIAAERQISIMKEQFGFADRTKLRMDFLEYFRLHLDGHPAKWANCLKYLELFTHGKCTFAEVNIDFCRKFRNYLLTAKQLRHPELPLNQNSASAYWGAFRALLKIARSERFFIDDLNDELDGIDQTETHKDFLTIDEVRALYNTPCADYPQVRAASLFAILTGLRISDIRLLRWDNFDTYSDGGRCIRIKTKKTGYDATLPISEEAYQLCGKPGKGNVFSGLTDSALRTGLNHWLKDAGITKHISFHCFRHTNATLLASSGVEIYTVSKMLTHQSVKTTQIYADLTDEKKRQAAETIRLKP